MNNFILIKFLFNFQDLYELICAGCDDIYYGDKINTNGILSI